MSVVVDVIVDPRKSGEGIAEIEDQLTGVENHGKAVGKSLGDALSFGGKTNEILAQLDALNDAIEREAAAFNRVKGPARNYESELQAVDDLHAANKISTAEWTAEVIRLNKALNATMPTLEQWDRKAHEAAKAASTVGFSSKEMDGVKTPKAGLLDGVADHAQTAAVGLVAGAGALLGKALVDEINHWAELKEEQRQAANTLSKYYDTNQQANSALREQKELALALHTTLGNAVGVYDAVRQATSDLYLTSQQQIDASRNLGRIMEMNGKPIGEAASVMERLQYAMELGTMSSLDFQSIAKKYPDILALWTEKTGKSAKELRQMAQDGKINTGVMRQFTDAIVEGEGVVGNYEKRTLTYAQAQKDLGLGVFETIRYVDKFNDSLKAEKDAFISLDEQARRIALSYQKLTDDVKKANEEVAKGQAIAALGFGASPLDRANRDNGMRNNIRDTLRNARQDLNDLNGMIAEGTVKATQQAQAMREGFMAALDPKGFASYKKIVGDTLEPQRQFSLDQRTLSGLLRSGAITVNQYTQEWNKLFAAFAGADLAKMLQVREAAIPSRGEGRYSPNDTYSEGDANSAPRFGSEFLEPRRSDDESYGNGVYGDARASRDSEIQMKIDGLSSKNPDEPDLNADLERAEANTKKLAEATKKWNEELQKSKQSADFAAEQIKNVATSLGKQLMDAANGSAQSWKEWGGTVLAAISAAIEEALILYALTGSASGAKGAGVGGGYGGLLGGIFGGSHADGGEYTVPGNGPADSKRVWFNLTPGEGVHFTPPGAYRPDGMRQGGGGGSLLGSQSMQRASGSYGPAPVYVVNQSQDPRALLQVLGGPAGRQMLFNFVQENQPALRAALQGGDR